MIIWEEPGRVSLHLIRLLLQIVQHAKGLLSLIERLECVRYHPFDTKTAEQEGSSTPRAPETAVGFDLTTDEAYQPVLIYFLSIPRGIKLHKRQGAQQS